MDGVRGVKEMQREVRLVRRSVWVKVNKENVRAFSALKAWPDVAPLTERLKQTSRYVGWMEAR